VARWFSVSRQTAYKMLPFFPNAQRIGRSWRVPARDVLASRERWIEAAQAQLASKRRP